jgi:hypothetical protein
MVKNGSDVKTLLNKDWLWGPLGISLKMRKPSFDPRKEPTYMQQNCVLLLGLPIELWSRKTLKGSGRSLGCFISLEENCWEKKDCRMFKILVEIYLREGLPTKMYIEIRT